MKKHLFSVALIMCLIGVGTASAQYTNIDDIQVYTAGLPDSPYAGTSVTVLGVVYERGQYSSGSHYIQSANGSGISIYLSGGGADLGDEVEVTGTVGAYSGEIQLGSPSFAVLSSGNTVIPTPTELSACFDYELVGTLVSTVGIVTSVSAPNFFITNGSDTLQVYIDSTTGIDLGAVNVGDEYKVTSPLITFNTTIELKPRFQSDLVEDPFGDTVPIIADVNAANWIIGSADPLVITATISDNSAIASATLYYADSDGTTQGAFTSVAMANIGGDTYEGTIPGGHSGAQVDFYVEATDDGAQTVTSPGAAPTTFMTASVGFTSLYDVNTVHPDSAYTGSPLRDRFVTIKGIVTAGTGVATASASRFIVQEMDKNPATNSYAFGGILVYEGSGTYEYFQGDEVAISGQIDEFFGLTEMIPLNADAGVIISFSNALPEPAKVSTRELSDNTLDDGTPIMGERWESVWVKTFPSSVVDTLGFGNYILSSTSARADSVDVDPIAVLAYAPTIGDVITMETYMTYAGGQFELVPFDDAFIINTGLSAVDDTPTIMPAGGFRSVAPNPFNPATTIKFAVNRASLVQLNVYNIRGQKVRTLVQDNLSANDEYTIFFDGKDDAGQGLASGAYFARLRIGKEVVQVRQMMLVK